jgi:hypothetical protein
MQNNEGFIHLNQIFKDEYGFDGKNLFKESFIQLESIGARRKFWFWYHDFFFMYKKAAYSIYEAYGELLSEAIARVLEIPCAQYMLADFDYADDMIDDFKASRGVITINFLKPGERLIPIGEIISEVMDSDILLDDRKKSLYGVDNLDRELAIHKMNNLEDIWPIFDTYFQDYENKDEIVHNLMDYLVNVYFFDLITLQGDRHIWNFGVIADKENHVRPAPIFDNSNMCNLNRPKTVQTFLSLLESPKLFLATKKVKLEKDLHNALYHSTMRFSANTEDFLSNKTLDKKADQLDSLTLFLKKSDTSYSERLYSYVEKLENYGIERILKEVEENTGHTFPDDFKKYIIYSMELNLNNIKEVNKNLFCRR